MQLQRNVIFHSHQLLLQLTTRTHHVKKATTETKLDLKGNFVVSCNQEDSTNLLHTLCFPTFECLGLFPWTGMTKINASSGPTRVLLTYASYDIWFHYSRNCFFGSQIINKHVLDLHDDNVFQEKSYFTPPPPCCNLIMLGSGSAAASQLTGNLIWMLLLSADVCKTEFSHIAICYSGASSVWAETTPTSTWAAQTQTQEPAVQTSHPRCDHE